MLQKPVLNHMSGSSLFRHFRNAILIHIVDAGSQEKSNPPVFVVGTVLQWLMESPCWGVFVCGFCFFSLCLRRLSPDIRVSSKDMHVRLICDSTIVCRYEHERE